MQIEAAARPGDRIRAEFKRQGVSISAWARKHNLSPQLVHRVLDKGAATRGESHRAAVLLGLKKAPIGDLDTFNPGAALANGTQD